MEEIKNGMELKSYVIPGKFTGDLYLDDDMESMGYLFEFCDEYAKKRYKKRINKEKFVDVFMKAPIRRAMDEWHPKLMSQAAEDTFVNFVDVDLDGDISPIAGKETARYHDYEMFWIGQMYAFAKNKRRTVHMIDIYKQFPLDEMRRIYVCGHQLEFEKAYERFMAD